MTLGVPGDDARYLTVDGVERGGAGAPTGFERTSPPRAFTYLSPERLGPRILSAVASVPPERTEVGARGEFVAHLLDVLGNRPSEFPERHAKPGDALLKFAVERWLSDMVRPVELDTETARGSGVTSLKFRVPGGDWVRAPNMGFGLTYVLPIVVAALVAPRDGMLVVENPEAHLHPGGQSRIGFFLATLAHHGLQVVVETHSDHVLNGIRRAIGECRTPAHDLAVVHYFEIGPGDDAVVKELEFTKLGGVSSWPPGFFDQFGIDVAALTRVRKAP